MPHDRCGEGPECITSGAWRLARRRDGEGGVQKLYQIYERLPHGRWQQFFCAVFVSTGLKLKRGHHGAEDLRLT